ncbi:metal ABC transporter permease [Paenibacillus swuensis]|uniref:Metal ABC transporter permease n=1 Tax=Paenibacillus swuensis TaxID=1178515 RepID=A0A172TQ53_9BACL|nr:metal ABC transporter permease [Paenibacillus swuensis]ANE49044.1 metal ABC transporter permease [Paenibacillus swuensis]
MDILFSDFFQRAIIGGLLIGLAAPLLGIFLVLRRLSMIGDTLAHVSIAGVAFGFIMNIYPLAMGLVFSIVAAFGIEKLRKAYKTYAELSIAIIMSGGVALATFLFSQGKGFNLNVTSYLFGSIYTLNELDVYIVGVVTLFVVGVVFFLFKEFFLLSFDEDAAGVSGLPTRYLNMVITVLTALVISVSIKIVGALLVSALLTIPVASSLVVSKGFKHTLILAVIYSEVAVVAGLLIAGLYNYAPGATIVLSLIAMLVLTLGVKRSFRI